MRVYSDFLLCVMLEGSWPVAYFTDAFDLASSKGGGGSGNISALLSSVPRDVNMQLLHVGDVKQKVNFVHKAPKKSLDLETAHRAQRISQHIILVLPKPKTVAEAEVVTVAAPIFRARPLNRKILNAPSLPLSKRSTPRLPEFQEFHLKTQERAMQHTSATSTSSLHCNDSDKDLDKHRAISVQENRIRDLRR
ncbi:Protein TPX2 [Glycine soja]